MTAQFKKATRDSVKLKVGIDGPSGSGKTDGALAIAKGITNGGHIAVIDSENESASYYADRYDFDTVPLENGDATALGKLITLAVDEKYDALVIDSLSHVWLSILAAKDAYNASNPSQNSYTTWGMPQFGPRWEKLMRHILNAPIHIVATMRSKQAYELVDNERGKKAPVKLGLQPQVRDGAEYEFGLVFSVNIQHRAVATKDRTGLFSPDELVDLRSRELHSKLIEWMNTETPATDEAVAHLTSLAENPAVSESAREVIAALVGQTKPGAAKVRRYTERLEAIIAAGTTVSTAPADAA
jgi:hypothetical protein